jgi:hypothetical protein
VNYRNGPYLTRSVKYGGELQKKNEAPAWDRGPRRVRFVVSVVFTPTRGVIHPSFPLRGRWERIAKSGEQAPSPSLASLLNSSCETHSCTFLMHGLRQCQARLEILPSLSLAVTWLHWGIIRTAPNPSLRSTLELFKTDSGTRRVSPIPVFPIPPSSRTPVTKYSVSPRYRFCGATPAESPHAHSSR